MLIFFFKHTGFNITPVRNHLQRCCIKSESQPLTFHFAAALLRTKGRFQRTTASPSAFSSPSPHRLASPRLASSLLQFLHCLNFSHCASLHLSNSSQTDASPELQSHGVEVMKATSRVPLQDPGSSSASTNSLI